MSAAQSGNRRDAKFPGSGRAGWGVGLAIASLLWVPTVSRAQMQALPPPPSAPNNFPTPDSNTAPFPSMSQPMPGMSGSPAPESVYPMPVQGASGYGGAYQVIVYGASPYLLRQIKFLDPSASMQTYQGRQVILAGTFDNPGAAQQRVLALSDYGVGAQVISANPGGSGQSLAGMSTPMTSGLPTPINNGMARSLVVPTTDPPPNLFPSSAPNATPNGFGPAPTAVTPTALSTNTFPGASVTPPPTVAQMGMPMNSLPDASVNTPMPVVPAPTPMNSVPNAPMDGAVIAPPPSVPMNSGPPNIPMTAPMGSPPLGTAPLGPATATPPTTAIPGNFSSGARYEVVIPARTEDFNAIANRLMGMGVRPDAIQGREKPRGPHIAVGPYMQAREAEAMSKLLQASGMDARVFYLR